MAVAAKEFAASSTKFGINRCISVGHDALHGGLAHRRVCRWRPHLRFRNATLPRFLAGW